jgi:hypothetical protein
MQTQGRGLRRRFGLAGILAGLVVGLAAPLPVAAGEVPVTNFEFEVGDNYVEGNGPPNTPLVVQLETRYGAPQGTIQKTTDGTGFWWGYMWGDMDPGDRLIATDGSSTRIMVVPTLDATVRRVSDKVLGHAPANSSVHIEVRNCQSYDGCVLAPDKVRPTNGAGEYTSDFTSVYNIRGDDRVTVTWQSPSGDLVWTERQVPTMTIWVNHAETWGYTKPAALVNLTLRKANGTLRARASDTGAFSSGSWGAKFKNSVGEAVNVRLGNWVTGSFANDATIQVRSANADIDPDTDVVSGRCYANRPFYVYAEEPQDTTRNPYWNEVDGIADGNGNFSVDLSTEGDNPGFDLVSGDIVEIGCRNSRGDELFYDFDAPYTF